MSELTQNQNNVVQSIQKGATTTEAIANASGIAKGSLTAVINSLIKRNLIQKDDAGNITLIASPDVSEDKEKSLSTSGNDSQQEINQTEESSPITLLIPYVKDQADGEELKYALRSWTKNFNQELQVVVIGDREDWFSDQVLHIPHEVISIKEVCGCEKPKMIVNPQADITHKLMTALAALELDGDVIYSNDDIFLLCSTHLYDLQFSKAFHHDLDETAKRDGLYAKNNMITAEALRKHGLPTVRYGTHTPVVFDAHRLAQVIEQFNATAHGYPVESIYFNSVQPHGRPIKLSGGIEDTVLASVYRKDVDRKILEKIFAERRFINCNSKGWPAVKPLLEEQFSEPSKFEK